MKRLVAGLIILVSAVFAAAQNNNSSSERARTAEPKPAATPKTVTKSSTAEPSSSPQAKKSSTTPAAAPSTAVLAAFDKIVEGIKKANVDLYMSGYDNASTLVLFNYNGTVTKGWEQVKTRLQAEGMLA